MGNRIGAQSLFAVILMGMSSHKFIDLQHPGTTDNCPVTTIAIFLRELHTKCREGKRDPNLHIRHSISEIKPELERLNTLVRSELSFEQLAAAEHSLPDVGFRYAVLYKDKRPVLFAYFQVFTLTAKNFNLHLNKNFVKHILSLLLNLKKAKALVLGNALRTEMPAYFYDDSVFSTEEAFDALAVIAERIAGDDDVSAIILPGIANAGEGESKSLEEMGYSAPWEDHVMKMDINPMWKTLDGYVADLTRKYKTRANKILVSAKQLVPVSITENNIARYQPDILWFRVCHSPETPVQRRL